MLACEDAPIGACIEALRRRGAPSAGARPGSGRDAIAEKTLAQIKLIGAVGRSVA